MVDFDVRIAAPADAGAVSRLLSESYGQLLQEHYAPQVLAAALPLMTRARPELLASGTYFVAVARRGGAVVGCGGWTRDAPRGDHRPSRAHIRHFATSPGEVRAGVGAAILRRCLDEIRVSGLADVECLSTLMAEPFYARVGFQRVGVETVRLGG
jgi:N-acetylglutamate synthase-like GNAT family acetyltransferase